MSGARAAGYPAPVEVAPVEQRWLAPVVWVAGSVVSRNDAQLASDIEGRLLQVAEEGVKVQAGDVVARVDDVLLKIALIEAETAVTQVQVRLDFLDREVARLRSLARQNNAARTQLDETEADRDGAINELAAARARLMTAQEQLARTELRAPFGGVVAVRLKRAGEWVGRGEAVVKIVDPEALEIDAALPLRLGPFVKVGQTVAVEVDGEAVEARVRRVVAVAEGPSRLRRLKLAIEAVELFAGQPVRVALPAAQPRKVLAIPRDAMVLRAEGVTVFRVKEDNTAEAVTVTTGVAQGEFIEVAGALKVGDQVVVRGGERLRPGQQLRLLGAPGRGSRNMTVWWSGDESGVASTTGGSDDSHSPSQWPDKKQWTDGVAASDHAASEE